MRIQLEEMRSIPNIQFPTYMIIDAVKRCTHGLAEKATYWKETAKH